MSGGGKTVDQEEETPRQFSNPLTERDEFWVRMLAEVFATHVGRAEGQGYEGSETITVLAHVAEDIAFRIAKTGTMTREGFMRACGLEDEHD